MAFEAFSLLPSLAHRQQNEIPPQEELKLVSQVMDSSALQSLEPGEGAQMGTLGTAPSRPAHLCLHYYPRILFVNNLL